MAEVSFHKEIESLRLGAGDTFYGEGILAVTKALLQSGVAYVGGYQGAPVSHLLDVLVQSEGLLGDLGIHLETCTNEAAAAAMLAASINYPLRGAVTWKSIVGTNVAADALSNLASPGVVGGALIIVGEDYGEGASVIQERTHAFALKSSLWLIDPRPDLPTLVRAVEKGFELSEASNTPVILELRIRACHMFGSFVARDNVAARFSAKDRLAPARFNYDRLSHPPATFRAGNRQSGTAAARGAAVHRRQQAQRAARARRRRHRHHRPGRPVQCPQRPACAGGPERRRRRRGAADPGAQCRAPAGARGDRRLLRRQDARCWWSRKATPISSSRRSARSCARPTSNQAAWQGPAADGGRIYAAGARQGPRRVPCPLRPHDTGARAHGSPRSTRNGWKSTRRWALPCRRGRRRSARAAPSGPCSRP